MPVELAFLQALDAASPRLQIGIPPAVVLPDEENPQRSAAHTDVELLADMY